MSFFWRLTKTGIKLGVIYAAVKVSLDYDVWSLNTGKGADNYARLQKTILPGLEIFSKLPSSPEVRRSVENGWNNIVTWAFNGLDGLRPQEHVIQSLDLKSVDSKDVETMPPQESS